jgi:hypothetical protein
LLYELLKVMCMRFIPDFQVSSISKMQILSAKKLCVCRESNPDQLLGRQLCWPLHHKRAQL